MRGRGRMLGVALGCALLGCSHGAPERTGTDSGAVPVWEASAEKGEQEDASTWSRVLVPEIASQENKLLDLGERLYGWNCFPCHGAEGKGDGPVAIRQGLFPRDFTRGLFKLKTSAPGEMPFDEDLYRTISVGIIPGGMPRNRDLEPQDRWALVAYVKSLAVLTKPDGARDRHFESKPPRGKWTPSAPPSARALDLARGKTLFASGVGCAACHGSRGKGNGPAAAELRDAWDRPVVVPDLSRGELGLKAGSELGDVFRTLTLGMAGTPMPSFESVSEEDRWNLAAYVRSLFEPISPGEKVFLGKGCLACHTAGRGKHVGPDLVGVGQRRDRAWLGRWLTDPPAMLAGDPVARKEFGDYKIQMPNLKLSPREIGFLIDYLEGLRSDPAR